MKYYTRNHIQIGDAKAFKQMLEDIIKQKKIFGKYEEYRYFSHNDKHYQFNTKVKIDATDS